MHKQKSPATAATAGGAGIARLGGEHFDTNAAARKAQGPQLVQLVAYRGDGAWVVDVGDRLQVFDETALEYGRRSGMLVCMCDICTGAMQ
jgi:hypothetical protein